MQLMGEYWQLSSGLTYKKVCRISSKRLHFTQVGSIQRSSRNKQHSKNLKQKKWYDKSDPEYKLFQTRIYLNKNLIACKDPIKLYKIILHHKAVMDPINISTAAVTISRLIQYPEKRALRSQQDAIEGIYDVLLQLMKRRAKKMEAWSLSNCLWSLGKLVDVLDVDQSKLYYITVFRELCKQVTYIAHDMTNCQISNSLWAMGKFKWKDNEQISLLIDSAIKAVYKQDVAAQDISINLWALATMEFIDVNAIDCFIQYLKNHIEDITSSQSVSNIMWALKKLRYNDLEMFKMVEMIILKSNLQFNSQEISVILLAFSDFQMSDKENVLSVLVEQFLKNNYRNVQDYVNVIFALSLLQCPIEIVQQVLNKFVAEYGQKLNTFSVGQLSQVRRAQLEYLSINQSLFLPQEYEQICKEARQVEMKLRVQQPYPFLSELFTFIKDKFENCQKRILVFDNELELNIEICQGENKIVILPLTKREFTSNQPQQLLGKTRSYRQLLSRLGWKVVGVNQMYWGDSRYQEKMIANIQSKLN
eukprot:TRINITY_DN7721_c0_g1_i1.p1 TRINITY_DN7721_c0_g1~~TRINITY_DN7721_c0_g1_i1.p1  ORF type:complete len:561 (-),score=43.17 TRINITY_DN7721_c0_g1_i1:67-1662(-)